LLTSNGNFAARGPGKNIVATDGPCYSWKFALECAAHGQILIGNRILIGNNDEASENRATE
jgi:hypothetical protein